MQNNPKILVASPTYKGMKYCHEKFFNRIKDLDYLEYDILIIDNSEDEEYFSELKKINGIIVIKDNLSEKNKLKRLINSRNKILDYALKNNYDYILMLDSDVIPPKNIITELLSCDKDIVTGLYFNYFTSSGQIKLLPVAWKSLTEEEFEELKKKINLPPSVKSTHDLKRHLTPDEIDSGQLLQVKYPSAGCMLISKNVFESKEIRYGLVNMFEIKGHTSDDINFFEKATEAGFKLYCYTKIKCAHLTTEKYKKDGNGIYHHPAYT